MLHARPQAEEIDEWASKTIAMKEPRASPS